MGGASLPRAPVAGELGEGPARVSGIALRGGGLQSGRSGPLPGPPGIWRAALADPRRRNLAAALLSGLVIGLSRASERTGVRGTRSSPRPQPPALGRRGARPATCTRRRPPVRASSAEWPGRPVVRSRSIMKPNFSLRLRVFNLNCWDIPYVSKRRADRIERLGDFLNTESFDLALLEEVWSEQDFQYLRQKLAVTYPAAHYFKSGIIGSGLCAFSKHPIQEICQHVYTLNGYPYMIHHGDWFCGKAVGLLVLHLSGVVLNAYVTHLHAEYNRQKDIYLTHRVAQAWELAQFIHHTSKKADVVLLCGDLNMHPGDLGCCLLKEYTGLHDAYLKTQDFKGPEEGYTMIKQNCYVSQQDLGPFPFGIRIDYVLYKAVSGFYISCKTLKTTTGHHPHDDTPLSDHEALMATLCVRHGPPEQDPSSPHGPAETSSLIRVLREAWMELGLGIARARWWTAFASYVIGLGLLFLVLLCVLAAGEGAREVAILLWSPSVGLVLGAGAVSLFHMQEAKSLGRVQAELQHVLGKAKEAQDCTQSLS